MEKLAEIIFSFDAFVMRDGGDAVPFTLRVAHPEYDGIGGCVCLVDCPFVREEPFKMIGADEDQACELTINFVRQIVNDTGARLIDGEGMEVTIPDIDFQPPHSRE